MTDDLSDPANRRRPPNQFAPGDRVRITSGKLAGLTGVVTRLSSRPDHVLIIDGWPGSTYLVVTCAAVERLAPGESAS